jgi:hypothetical protein
MDFREVGAPGLAHEKAYQRPVECLVYSAFPADRMGDKNEFSYSFVLRRAPLCRHRVVGTVGVHEQGSISKSRSREHACPQQRREGEGCQ